MKFNSKLAAEKRGLELTKRAIERVKKEGDNPGYQSYLESTIPGYEERIKIMQEDQTEFPTRILPFYSTNFAKPIRNGKLTKYAKILLFAYHHKGQEFTRFDLFKQSGFLSEENIKGFETGTITRSYIGWNGEKYEYQVNHTGKTPNSRCRGYSITYTAGMRTWGLLEYNTKTKKWKAGPNLEKYLQLKGLIK